MTMTMTNAFIAFHVSDVDADLAWARRTRRGDKVVCIVPGVADVVRATYAAAHGDRPVYGPAGVGRAAFAAVVAAVVADINWANAQYAQFCADDDFAAGG